MVLLLHSFWVSETARLRLVSWESLGANKGKLSLYT